MTLDEYRALVWRNLPPLPDPQDKGLLDADITGKYEQGWSVAETCSMLRCTEHVNPSLPEEVALSRMRHIRSRVEARLLTPDAIGDLETELKRGHAIVEAMPPGPLSENNKRKLEGIAERLRQAFYQRANTR